MNTLVFNLDEELKNNRIQSQFNPSIVSQMMLSGKNNYYPNNNSLQFQENLIAFENNCSDNNDYAKNIPRKAFEQNVIGNPCVASFAREANKFANNPNPIVNMNINSATSKFFFVWFLICFYIIT